jgi:heat-inducible transcriptional repressor
MRKNLPIKITSRELREREVLLGLVKLFLEKGKPIGSNTLKECGFEHLSSATIRNYFARLEIEGFLAQHHASGGRIPTDKAYRLYANSLLEHPLEIDKHDRLFLSSLLDEETKEISPYLQKAVEAVSEMTGSAAFLTAPRFDQDFIVKMRLLEIDDSRALCVVVTDFGLIHTEALYFPHKMSKESLKKIEEYFHFRLTGSDKVELSNEELRFAQQSYNEVVLRHFVSYTNMRSEDIYKTGFSKLLLHAEFHDPLILSSTLSLFENTDQIRTLLRTCYEKESLSFWIGEDLKEYIPPPVCCSLIAVPYRIHNKIVGSIAVLGSDRANYERVFSILEHIASYVSQSLTKSMYKFKLTYRQPSSKALDGHTHTQTLIENHNG